MTSHNGDSTLMIVMSPDTLHTLKDCCKRTLCDFKDHKIDFNDSRVQDVISALYELGFDGK